MKQAHYFSGIKEQVVCRVLNAEAASRFFFPTEAGEGVKYFRIDWGVKCKNLKIVCSVLLKCCIKDFQLKPGRYVTQAVDQSVWCPWTRHQRPTVAITCVIIIIIIK